jgi:hypothetical protein
MVALPPGHIAKEESVIFSAGAPEKLMVVVSLTLQPVAVTTSYANMEVVAVGVTDKEYPLPLTPGGSEVHE